MAPERRIHVHYDAQLDARREGAASSPGGTPGERGVDWAIAELAGRQHGVAARWQIDHLGPGAIDLRVRNGRLHPVHRGVYAIGHRVLSREGRYMAAVLAAGARAVLSHRSAASLLGMLRWAGAIEVTAPGLRIHRGIRAHRGLLLPDEVTVHEGIPITTPARTAIDLAPLLDREAMEGMLQEMEVRALYDRVGVQELLRRHAGRRGTARLREAKADPDTLRSDLEREFRRLVRVEQLERPEFNATIALPDDFMEVDCLWRGARLVVELDSRKFHGNTRAFERDRLRDRRLIAARYRVMRITARMMREERAALVRDLHASLS